MYNFLHLIMQVSNGFVYTKIIRTIFICFNLNTIKNFIKYQEEDLIINSNMKQRTSVSWFKDLHQILVEHSIWSFGEVVIMFSLMLVPCASSTICNCIFKERAFLQAQKIFYNNDNCKKYHATNRKARCVTKEFNALGAYDKLCRNYIL